MIRNNRSPGRTRSRRGITLIEVLILVTCIAVMLGLCAVTIQLMLRLFTDNQARLTSSVMLERLARQLRDDAHASQSARIEPAGATRPDPPASLLFSLRADRAITYKVLDGAIARDETLGGRIVRHESYSLPRGREARFTLGEEGGRPMVALLLTQSPRASKTESPRPLEVLAVVGKHRAGPTAKPEERKR